MRVYLASVVAVAISAGCGGGALFDAPDVQAEVDRAVETATV